MQVLVLAFEAALYPTLLAAVVILLAQPRRFVLLSAYLAGGLAISIAAGLAIIAGLKGSGAVKTSDSGLSWGADLAVGGLALLLAVALSTRADERFRARRRARHPQAAKPKPANPDREPWSERLLARGSVPIVVLAALALNVPGAAYLIALKDIAAGGHSTAGEVAWVLVFNLIMFLLAEIPWLGLVFAPTRTDALVDRMNAWMSRNSRTIAVVLCAVLGAFLVVRGLLNA